MSRFGSFRCADNDIVGQREDFVQPRDWDDSFGKGRVPSAGSGNTPDPYVESPSATGEFLTNGTEAHDQQQLPIQFGQGIAIPKILLRPVRAVLIAHRIRKIAGERDQKAKSVFRHGYGKQSARVGDDDSRVAKFGIDKLCHSGRGRMDPFEPSGTGELSRTER